MKCGFFPAIFRLLAAIAFVFSASNAMAVCALQSAGGQIKHVVHIEFDNLHLQRDNPNVPSDLEQMEYLRSFLAEDGVIGGDHHTSLPSNAASNALTILTGVYGDRMGVPISDSYGYFVTDGTAQFTSAYSYWTAKAPDGLPQMLAETGKNAPAPWVPFTRAGCDVGTFAVANMALESIPSDAVAVFGKGSAEAAAAAVNPIKAKADLQGIAIHCARDSRLCSDPAHARPDLLPDEPGLYRGFNALFGNAHVVAMLLHGASVKDLNGRQIEDSYGNPGFPNLFTPSVSQSLGYAAAMLEAGVPVVYAYVGDTHEQLSASGQKRPLGPGEAAHMKRLADDDKAFQRFVLRLAASGITKDNTLFILVSDEGGHFAGGDPVPKSCDGLTVPCSYPDAGEIDVSVDRLLAMQRRNVTPFDLHFDNAAAFYIRGNPSSSMPLMRQLEQDTGKLGLVNPISKRAASLTTFLADRGAMKLLHMVTASPTRTPSFIAFATSDVFQMAAASRADCGSGSPCIKKDPAYAWNHGGADPDMSQTWFGLVGPGIRPLGLDKDFFSDSADIRPTMLALLGLTDDYIHDGRVLAELFETRALPSSIQMNQPAFAALAHIYKVLNAPLGALGKNSLVLATQATAGPDSAYEEFSMARDQAANARDLLAREMSNELEGAFFANRAFDPSRASYLVNSAQLFIQNTTLLTGADLSAGVSPAR